MEVEQKTLNLESQKTLTKMTEQSNTKFNSIITKMGEKLITLEDVN
jgi:hypothetical protein